jgi:hypothetical protein
MMNILDMMKEGLRVALTCRALWLYGFFIGLGLASNSGSKDKHPAAASLSAGSHLSGTEIGLLIGGVLILLAIAFMYFLSEGALIEGVRRLRTDNSPTMRQGWRDGFAHWGVLCRIAIVYFASSATSALVLAAPALIAMKLSGSALAIAFAIPAALIGVPWLVTLYMWQAFASRIAVIENRHARDAIGKARLFLHGRLVHGLKLIVASILGQMLVAIVGAIVLAAVTLTGVGVLTLFGSTHVPVAVIALGVATLLPLVLILVAISGTTHSSIWTIGYLTQEQQ